MSVEFRMTGMDQFKQKIDKLRNPKKAKSIARKAARQAMNIVRDSARVNARAIDDPETREKIHKNIVTQGGKSRNPNEIKIRVGVKGGAGQNQYSVSTAGLSGGDTRHFRFIEFGTSKIPATPFLRPALANNADKVITKFVQVFDTEITKALREAI